MLLYDFLNKVDKKDLIIINVLRYDLESFSIDKLISFKGNKSDWFNNSKYKKYNNTELLFINNNKGILNIFTDLEIEKMYKNNIFENILHLFCNNQKLVIKDNNNNIIRNIVINNKLEKQKKTKGLLKRKINLIKIGDNKNINIVLDNLRERNEKNDK